MGPTKIDQTAPPPPRETRPSAPAESAPPREAAAGAPAGEGGEPAAAGARERRSRPRPGRLRRLVPLPLGLRIALFLLGWILLLVGVAGLVLPGIQGVLTIFAGAAILSLVSELVYKWLRALLHRWPVIWRRVEGFRLKLHRRLRRRRR